MIARRVAFVCLGAIVAVWQPGKAVAEAGSGVGDSERFGDIGGLHAYGIEQIFQLGIDTGCGEGRFCPDDPISRAEMAAWLYRATARLDGVPPPPTPQDETAPGLSDMPDSTWYGHYARWAAANGVITAPGGVFNPNSPVTRAEAAVMFTAAFGHLAPADEIQEVFADTDYTSATGAIEGIHAAGLTKGCATNPLRYCPYQPITRAQTATMLARAIQRAEPTIGLIVNKPQAARGYTLLYSRNARIVYLIDSLGRYVHKWELPGHIRVAELLENGNLLTSYRQSLDTGTFVTEFDRASNIVWEYTVEGFHHDFLKLPNGNILLLMSGRMTSQDAIAVGADPRYMVPDEVRYDYLREVKPTGPNSSDIVWEWSVLDHLIQDNTPTAPNYGAIAGNPQRIHINYLFGDNSDTLPRHVAYINAIDYNPVLDYIMLSSRSYSELWIIDHNTTTEEAAGPKGDLLYRWGNPRVYGAGDYQDQQLFGQHDTQWIPHDLPGAGNVLIFNNGTEFTVPPRRYSTIDEIILPDLQGRTYPQTRTLAFAPPGHIWTYTAPKPADFYAYQGSGTQRLPNGNTQICEATSGTIFQVTSGGELVWKYINPTYRGRPKIQGESSQTPTYRAPWYPPDYPGLKDMELTPKGPIEQYR